MARREGHDERGREECGDRSARGRGEEPRHEGHHDGAPSERARRLGIAEGEIAALPPLPARAEARERLDREADRHRCREDEEAGEVVLVDVRPEDGPVPAGAVEAPEGARTIGNGLDEGDHRDREAGERHDLRQAPRPRLHVHLAPHEQSEERQAGEEREAAQGVDRAHADRPRRERQELEPRPVRERARAHEAEDGARQRDELEEDEAVRGEEQAAAGQRADEAVV